MEDPGSDLSQLDKLTEESILEAVKNRYQEDKIYSSVGEDILLAVNPCKELPIYDKENHEKFLSENFKPNLPPHVFRMAAQAYLRMRQKQSNQIILVCGESGAGKTESAKYMVQHFMEMCPDDSGDLHERIIRVNPLLESFGNAKTVMNDNSSRFAKFLELSFGHDGQVIGASIRDYMLEKCRVVGRNEDCGEGNFHIFYGMFAGLSQQEKQDLFLLKLEKYSILKGSIKSLKMTNHYENQYRDNMETLKKIGMTEADKKVMHCMLAAILHLSQIEFDETDKASGQLDIVDTELVEQAASLLEVSSEAIGHALISSTTIMAGDKIKVYKSLDQATDGRDALAKHMYERLFGWIVKKINKNLHPNHSSKRTKVAEIGILDIAGFENLQTNSFEQMCINMVNERLQYFMNNVVLIQEKKIYESEEIPFENVEFKDNMNIIQMFEISKIGIWPSLDEESKFRQGTDSKFVERLKKNFPKGHAYNPLLTFARGDRIGFGVKHFAGAVWYNCENFLEKNRDTLNKDIEDVMKSSKDDCIADLFSVRKGDTGTISSTLYDIRASRKVPGLGGSIRAKTDQGGLQGMDLGRTLKEKYGKVGKPTELIYMPNDSKTNVGYFQKSISQLLSKLRHADSFFVRCIKPNRQMAPEQLDEEVVKEQLKYNGISEICLIRKNGYPSRILIEDFIKRYKPLFSFRGSNNKDMVQTILEGTLPIEIRDKYRIGKNKVFMKERVNLHIEEVYFIRQKWAASVIANVLRKNCEVQKRERIKREQKEKERKRKLEEERKRKMEEEEKNRGTEEQLGKDKEKAAEVYMKNSVNSLIEKVNQNKEMDKEKERTFMAEEDERTQNKETRTNSDVKKTKRKVTFSTFSNNMPSHSSVSSNSRLTTELNSDNDTGKKNSTSTSKLRFWDMFSVIPRERKTQDVHTFRSLRIIKVCAYFILFLMLLASLVIQKISVITLISQLRPEKIWNGESEQSDKVQNNKAKVASACYMFTLLAMCTPYVFMFIGSAWMSIFKNIPFPSFSSIVVCVVIEILHSIGLCLLVFHLLPDLGVVQGIGLLSAVAIVPSLLKPFSSYNTYNEKKTSTARRRILFFVLDLMAILAQFSAIPVVIIPNTQFLHGNGTHTIGDLVNRYKNESMSTEFSINTPLHSFKIVGALFLCSLSWWENFVDDEICNTIPLPEAFVKIKSDLQERRPIIFLFVSFFKIGTSVVFAYLLMQDSLTFGFNEIGKYEEMDMYSDILALILSGYVGYYLAYTVCKLQMQRLSFSIPCLISTPIAIIALLLECNTDLKFVWAVSKRSLTQNCDANMIRHWFHLPLAVFWLISLYWVAQHIWFPTQERLAKVERLFVNPLYCGILLEQHLVLNRKRHNHRIIFDSKQNTHFMTAAKDSNSGAKDISPNDTEQTDVENIIPPMIYACATMWHENRVEMLQLLKSLFRMDKDQFERKQEFLKREKKETTEGKSLRDTDYYEFEAHILFDDAFESDDNEDSTPNRFVLEFASLMNEAASAVHSTLIEIKPPFIMPSHYGGQLIFVMPGNNFIYTHLKDKKEIRHKKRWSQVMYMYYLLGYRIMKECRHIVLWGDQINERTGRSGKSALFRNLTREINFKAENTFLLALDGDVDFTPGAVRLLLDRMRKNLSVGAACGRIHPIGSGPMVWYQKFEYAVAHWLQKATEHVLGCVLCSPGCFSMFRGSALMDDNVMKKYTTLATEPSEHLMYDQGEDRWLCTLLLQQGYRVDYAAASDAFTYAPESFNEYFNQRRRWTPSTIANILELLQDGRNTVASNNNISWLYIVYQGALMVSTIIGPATVLMMIAGALLTVFDISLVTSYVVSLIPAIIFFIICLVFDTKIQLIVAQILSGIYIFIMMVVFVGIVITAVTITPYHPSVIFLSGLVFIFLIAAALHPKEFHNLVFGILYFLWVPSGFLVLVIYSLCNLHVVSWGTREVPNKKTKVELEQEQAEKKAKEEQKKKESFWNKFFPFFNLVQELKQTMSEKMTSDKDKERDALVDILKKINDNLEKINMKKCDRDCGDIVHEDPSKKERKTVKFSDEPQIEEQGNISLKKKYANKEKKRNIDERCPAWIKKFGEHREPLLQMVAEEEAFWKEFVEKYLKPMEKDKRKEKEDTEKLKELRNNVCGGMALINMLWVAINFMFQYRKPTVISIPLPHGNKEEDIVEQSADNVLKVDVVGLMFIIFFLFILFVQFFGMIVHRWGTFMHLIAITEIPTPFRGRKTEKTLSVNMEENTTTDLPGEPSGDYSSDEDDYDDDITEREEKDYFVTQIINNAETGTKDRVGEMKNMASLRNSTKAKRSSKFWESNKSDNVDSNVNKLSVKERRKFSLAASVREDFLKDLNNTTAKKKTSAATRNERAEEDLGRSFNRGDDVDLSECGEKHIGIMARERARSLRRSNRIKRSTQNQNEITQL